MPKQPGFFDLEDRYAELSKAGDPLEKLGDFVNFEAFRYRLNKALKRSDGSQGGRPAPASHQSRERGDQIGSKCR